MATFAVEDLDISPNEYLAECTPYERKQLFKLLTTEYKMSIESLSVNESLYEEMVASLHGKFTRISKEEEEIITIIARKYKT